MTKVSKDKKVVNREKLYKRSFKVVLVLGVGASIVSYKMGRKHGCEDGIDKGYVKAGHEIVESWRKHAEEMRLAREARS